MDKETKNYQKNRKFRALSLLTHSKRKSRACIMQIKQEPSHDVTSINDVTMVEIFA